MGKGVFTPRDDSHTSNFAVIVSSSRYWFNYRHAANALSIYSLLKENGFHDEHIILMLADEFAANPRNPFRNRIYTAGQSGTSLYDSLTQIDYRGDDVTAENLVRVLLGRQGVSTGLPVLQSDSNSNILVYLTGHGGDQFFKFQDVEEISAEHLADVFRQMHTEGRYREVLLVADTCKAFTLADKIDTPNVTSVGSSLRGENSYAHHADADIGVSVIEHYTHAFMEFTAGKDLSKLSLKQSLVEPYSYEDLGAHVGWSDKLSVRKIHEVPLSDFFVDISVERKTRQEEQQHQVIVSSNRSTLFSFPVMDTLSSETLYRESMKFRSMNVNKTVAEWSGNGTTSNCSQFQPVDPTDVKFIGWVGIFLVVLFLTSKHW